MDSARRLSGLRARIDPRAVIRPVQPWRVVEPHANVCCRLVGQDRVTVVCLSHRPNHLTVSVMACLAPHFGHSFRCGLTSSPTSAQPQSHWLTSIINLDPLAGACVDCLLERCIPLGQPLRPLTGRLCAFCGKRTIVAWVVAWVLGTVISHAKPPPGRRTDRCRCHCHLCRPRCSSVHRKHTRF